MTVGGTHGNGMLQIDTNQPTSVSTFNMLNIFISQGPYLYLTYSLQIVISSNTYMYVYNPKFHIVHTFLTLKKMHVFEVDGLFNSCGYYCSSR